MSNRPLVLPFALSVLAFSSASLAQTPIQAGQPLQGRLSADSPRADDGTPYELYVYRGPAGQRVRVTMDSDAFDAYLAVGSVAAPSCPGDCRTNDDGGEGTNSALTYTIPASGSIQIRANSISDDDTGPYTLQVAVLPPATAPRVQPLNLNESVSGTFGDDSALDDDDRPFQLYSIRGRAGQELVIRLDSSDFDPIVALGQWRDGVFHEQAVDDDGGAGLNARLRTRLDSSGQGVIKAYAVGSGSQGAYRLRVGDPPAPRPMQTRDVSVGESVRGQLSEDDSFTPDEEIHFHAYRIQGRAGQRVTVRMESSDFDPLLRWGHFDGDRLIEEAMDDDSGGGTSAQLTVTLDEGGESRLVATSYNGGLGQYVLSVVSAPR